MSRSIDESLLAEIFNPDRREERRAGGSISSRMWHMSEQNYEQDTNAIIKMFSDLAARLQADRSLTYERKRSFFDYTIGVMEGLRRKVEDEYTIALPKPTDNYPRYPGKHENALEWLEKHWGRYLKYFGAEKNSIYQDQLRKLDPALMEAITSVKYRCIVEARGKKVRDIIPTKSDRTSEIVSSISGCDDKEKIISAYYFSSRRERNRSNKLLR